MEGWRGGCREGCRIRRKDARRDGRIYAQLWVRGGSPTEDTRSSPHNGVTAHSPAPLPAPAPCWSRKRKKNKSFHSPPPHRCKISAITQQPPAKPRVWPWARRASQHPHTHTGTPTCATPHHAGPEAPRFSRGEPSRDGCGCMQGCRGQHRKVMQGWGRGRGAAGCDVLRRWGAGRAQGRCGQGKARRGRGAGGVQAGCKYGAGGVQVGCTAGAGGAHGPSPSLPAHGLVGELAHAVELLLHGGGGAGAPYAAAGGQRGTAPGAPPASPPGAHRAEPSRAGPRGPRRPRASLRLRGPRRRSPRPPPRAAPPRPRRSWEM